MGEKMLTLSSDLTCKILTHIDIEDLPNVACSCKHFGNLMRQDKIWTMKILEDYPPLFKLKPENLTALKYYQRLVKSGILSIKKNGRTLKFSETWKFHWNAAVSSSFFY